MDRERFDALAKLLATTGSRRATLGALCGAGLLGRDADALANPGNGNTTGHRADRVQVERHGQDRQRRKRHRHQDHDGEQHPEPPPAPCCGTKPCAPPAPGSTRSGCDFAGQSFAGEDLQRAIFRQIDGRGADFAATDLGGAIFAEACLHGASFRGAHLGRTIWRDACLVAADFTDADLDSDSAAFRGALLCATILPDGTIANRDCGQTTRCCLPASGGPQPSTCQQACPSKCGVCVHGPNGLTRCTSSVMNIAIFCNIGCASDDDCLNSRPDFPYCTASWVNRATGQVTQAADGCGPFQSPAYCSQIDLCT